MSGNVIAIVCVLVALLAGGYSIWSEIGPTKKDDREDKDKHDDLNN